MSRAANLDRPAAASPNPRSRAFSRYSGRAGQTVGVMKPCAILLGAVALAVAAPAVLTNAALAQPFGRGAGQGEAARAQDRAPGRVQERSQSRAEARAESQSRYRPDAEHRAPAYPGAPRPYAYPAPPYAYPTRPYGYAAPAYPYPRPGPSAYAPLANGYASRPGYTPDSLGAEWGQQQDAARRGVRQGGLMPLSQVMTLIRRRTPGRLLDAGLEPAPDGRPAYRVRWAATGGRRIDFIVDAATGAIIGRSGY